MGADPLLNILVRTSNRPNAFNRCYNSIKKQTYTNFRIIVSYDNDEDLTYLAKYSDITLVKINKKQLTKSDKTKKPKYATKYFPHNLYFNKLHEEVNNGWILYLDDDNYLYDENSLKNIKTEILKQDEDTLLILKTKYKENRVLPEAWPPKLFKVDTSNVCFNHKYKKLKWDSWNRADYRFIRKISRKIKKHKKVECVISVFSDRGKGKRKDINNKKKNQKLNSLLKNCKDNKDKNEILNILNSLTDIEIKNIITNNFIFKENKNLIKSNELTVYVVIKNDTHFIEKFIKHYKDNGAKRIIFIDDNEDSDELNKIINKYKKCHVFKPKFGDFKNCKVIWIHLLLKYLQNKNSWFMTVDMDEFVDIDNFKTFDNYVNVLEENNKTHNISISIDMLPVKNYKKLKNYKYFYFELTTKRDRRYNKRMGYIEYWKLFKSFDSRFKYFGTFDGLRKISFIKNVDGLILNQGFHNLNCDNIDKMKFLENNIDLLIPIKHYKYFNILNGHLNNLEQYYPETGKNIEKINNRKNKLLKLRKNESIHRYEIGKITNFINDLKFNTFNFKSYLNKKFDNVYVLNLKKDKKKYIKIKKKLDNLNIIHERFEGVNGYRLNLNDYNINIDEIPDEDIGKSLMNGPSLGCLLSHIEIIKDAKKNKYKKILIFEDDVLFHKDFEEKIKLLDDIPNWKMLYFGCSQYDWSKLKYKNDYYFSYLSLGTFAYALDHSIYDMIIDYDIKNSKDKLSIDNFYGRVIQKKLKGYCFTMFPNLCIADVRDSRIREGRDIEKHSIKMKWNIKNYNIDEI